MNATKKWFRWLLKWWWLYLMVGVFFAFRACNDALFGGRYEVHASPFESYDEEAESYRLDTLGTPSFSDLIMGKVQDTLFQELVGIPGGFDMHAWASMTVRLNEPLALERRLPLTEEDSLLLHRWLWQSTWNEQGLNPVTPWEPDGRHWRFTIERYAWSDSLVVGLSQGSYQLMKTELDGEGYVEEWMIFDESSYLAHYFLLRYFAFQ